MKLFSLLSGKQVHLQPGKKRVPASEFSLLINAAELLDTARKEATDFRKEVAIEAEQIREQAFQEGFQEGLKTWNHQLLILEEGVKKLREEISEKILPLALGAAKKIFGEELKTHPDRIIDIIRNVVKPVVQHKKIHIYVNKSDLPILEEKKSELKALFEHLESLVIQERSDIEPGGCMIETEAGILNAQLENQWRALEAAFKTYKGTL
ncbi:MAG TPA: HrpE/YscL family type III secretion apparatus protein [Chlamydiales bacterium]|nr:HrpE/YscL family type III secretion apparatus protein [Chlamydiales bacterium]